MRDMKVANILVIVQSLGFMLFFEIKQKIYMYSDINYQETRAFELEVLKLKGEYGLNRKVGIF